MPRMGRRRVPRQIGSRGSRLNSRAPLAQCGPTRGDEFRTLTMTTRKLTGISKQNK